ncbi:MAG: hypothetical protein GVX96_00280 [Bacteroidetes bacterium]|jgi:hypothetical protein|nr:hypothetical protein [Bacteroidota bacterium]
MLQNLYISLILLILFGLGYSSCENLSGDPLENYYLPAATKNDGIVHQFEIQGLQGGKEYWYYNLQEREDSTFLLISVYDESLEQQQLSLEKPVENGWIQKKLLLFFRDSTRIRRENVNIRNPNRFAFDLQDSLDVLLYRIKWTETLNKQNATKELIRNSRFWGFDSVEFMGKRHLAAHFKSREEIQDTREGTLTIELNSDEYYVKNWGLIEKKQYYANRDEKTLIRHLKLTDTMRMSDLEQILKEKQ